MRRTIRIPIFLAFFLVAFPSAGKRTLETEFHVGPLYDDGGGQASVVVELPYGITQPAAENFRMLMNENPEFAYYARQVKSFIDSGHELALLLCIDVSGTMAGAPLKHVKDDLLTLIAKRQQMRFAVMTFGTEINLVADFNNPPERLTSAIAGLRAGGAKSRTRLYDALYKALDYYGSENKFTELPTRKRILVISDGKDEGSDADSDSVKQRSAALGIPVDTVGVGKIDAQYVKSLSDLAEGTGGHFVHVRPDQVSLQDALIRIYRELTETQTIVAYFQGLPVESERLTDTVDIQLQLPDGRLLSRSLKAKLPLPAQPAPPDSDGYILLWVLVGVLSLLCIVAALVYLWRKKKDDETPSPPLRPKIDAPLPEGILAGRTPRKTDYQTDTPAAERRTSVSGYFPPPGMGRPAAILVGIGGSVKGRQYNMETDLFQLGASPDNDVVLGDDYVSSNHAQVRYEKGSLLLTDQGARNGTFLNDQRLGDVPLILSPGDHIRVGNSTFEVIKAPGR